MFGMGDAVFRACWKEAMPFFELTGAPVDEMLERVFVQAGRAAPVGSSELLSLGYLRLLASLANDTAESAGLFGPTER